MKKDIGEIIHGKPHVIIGKKMISPEIVEEITHQFDVREYIKVKFLDLPLDSTIKTAANEIASITKSQVRDTRGKTCVLQRKKKK